VLQIIYSKKVSKKVLIITYITNVRAMLKWSKMNKSII